MRLKPAIYENTRVSPQKEANPASLRSAAPSYGRRCPEGAEVGWGKRYEKERERSSQVCRLREHPSAAPKGSQPRLDALSSPFQGKGLAWTLPPSYGRRCPEGAEVGWGKAAFPTQSLPLGEADDTRSASAHKALRHRPYIFAAKPPPSFPCLI